MASGASTEVPSSDAGRAWFEKNKNKFKKTVCGSNVVKGYLEADKTHNRVLLVAAIADLIVTACGGIPPITVAVLLVTALSGISCIRPVTSPLHGPPGTASV